MTEKESDDASGEGVATIRAWSEEVRRRELATAFRRLEASGEVTPDERAVVADASQRIVESLVDQWVSNCRSDDAAVVADVVTD
jgi:hypothetical protein